MKEYSIWIEESFWKNVRVQAEDRDKAYDAAYDMVLEGINWIEEAESGSLNIEIEELDEEN